jgi:hypothetical protein
VTYPGASAFCESNTLSATIQHTVTLGVYCDLRPDDPYFFVDLYFECPKASYQFDFLATENLGFNSTFGRYACSAFAEFATGSSASSPQTISSVAATMDDYWRSNASDSCYTRISSAAPVPLTNAPVTPMPTAVMNTTSPSLFPTLPPVDAPIRPSTKPPAVAAPAPILPREAPTKLTEETTDSGDGNNGALIGGVVGGIAAALVIGALIGFFVFRRSAESSSIPKPAVSGGVAPTSMTEGTAGHDNLLGPAQPMLATQPIPSTTPIPPPAPAIAVARPRPRAPVAVPLVTVTNEVPAIAVAEIVPFATAALDASAASAGSQKTQSEPPGRIYTEM